MTENDPRSPWRAFWMVLCSLFFLHSYLVAFIATVVIMNVVSLSFGVSWASLLLGLAISIISVGVLRLLVYETYINLAEGEFKVSRETAEHMVKELWKKKGKRKPGD